MSKGLIAIPVIVVAICMLFGIPDIYNTVIVESYTPGYMDWIALVWFSVVFTIALPGLLASILTFGSAYWLRKLFTK